MKKSIKGLISVTKSLVKLVLLYVGILFIVFLIMNYICHKKLDGRVVDGVVMYC